MSGALNDRSTKYLRTRCGIDSTSLHIELGGRQPHARRSRSNHHETNGKREHTPVHPRKCLFLRLQCITLVARAGFPTAPS